MNTENHRQIIKWKPNNILPLHNYISTNYINQLSKIVQYIETQSNNPLLYQKYNKIHTFNTNYASIGIAVYLYCCIHPALSRP